MDYFPLIHTNIWDAVIGVPVVLCVTQLIKVFCRVPGIFVPTIALAAGNVVSIVFGHHEHVYAGILWGFLRIRRNGELFICQNVSARLPVET